MTFNFRQFSERPAIVHQDREYSYAWLAEQVEAMVNQLAADKIEPGAVVALESDFNPRAVALFFALAERDCIIVPLAPGLADRKTLLELAGVEYRLAVSDQTESVSPDTVEPESVRPKGRVGYSTYDITVGPESVRPNGRVGYSTYAKGRVGQSTYDSPAEPESVRPSSRHPLYRTLEQRAHPGLVLFSSGTTGQPKAAVHDLQPLLDRFARPRHAYRAIAFLMFDHIGGLNTMLYMLSSGGCLVLVPDRRPDTILRTIERHQVELLPVTPTFLNMILLSQAYREYDLRSLQVVSYGTEPMPESTLKQFHRLFPKVRLQQTYGLSEIGIPATKSKSSDSLWLSIGGSGVETRVVDGVLHIKSSTAMLGYLNAPSPFTQDGWLNTGDAVEVDGEYFRFLGREDERINVGGEKVYPTEIENALLEMKEVADAAVHGEKNLLTGTIVVAEIQPTPQAATMEPGELRKLIRNHCANKLSRFKVPARINLVSDIPRTERGKKQRSR